LKKYLHAVLIGSLFLGMCFRCSSADETEIKGPEKLKPAPEAGNPQNRDLEFKTRNIYIPFIWWDIRMPEKQSRFTWTAGTFFRYTREPGVRFNMFFPVGFKYSDRNRDAVFKGALGIWWNYRDREKTFNMLGPWVSFRRTSPQFSSSFKTLVPLFAAYDSTHGNWTNILLLFHYAHNKVKKAKSFAFLPFLFFKSGIEESEKQAALFPLFWYARKGDTQKSVITPLGFYTRKGDAQRLLALNWYESHDQGDSFRTFFPLYWQRSQKTETYVRKTHLLLPIWFFDRKDSVPADGSEKPGNRIYTRNVVVPLWYYSKKGTGDKTFATLFGFYSRRDKSRRLLVLNTYWSGSPEGMCAAFFPLFFHKQDAERKYVTDTFVPLYYYRRDPHKKDLITPISWIRTYRKGGSRGFVLPVYWNTSSGMRSWGLFPVMGRFKDTYTKSSRGYVLNVYWQRSILRKTAAFFPLFFHRKDHEKDETLSITLPLYFYKRDPEKRDLITPISWIRKYRSGGSRGFFLPVYWDTSKRKYSLGMFPLAGHFKDKEKGTSTGYFLNFFRRITPERDYSIFFPFYYTSRKNEGKAVTRVLVPLMYFHKDPESSTTAFAPVFYSRTSKTQKTRMVFPILFYYKNIASGKKCSFILPFYFKYRDRMRSIGVQQTGLVYWAVDTPGRKIRVLPPYFSMDSRSGSSVRTFFPIWWYSGTDTVKNYCLFPLYYRRKTPDSYLHVTPLFFAGRQGNTWNIGFSFGPLVEMAKTGTLSLGLRSLFPFFASFGGKDEKFHMHMLAPLYAWWRTGKNRMLISPVGFSRKTPKTSHWMFLSAYSFKGPDRSYYGFFPVWWGRKSESAQRRHDILFPLWYYRSDRSDRLLITPVGYYTKNLHAKHSLFLNYFRYEDTMRKTSVLFPLYCRTASQGVQDTFTPLSWIRNYKQGGSRGFVLPVYWNTSGNMRSWGVFPLVGHYRNISDRSSRGHLLNVYWQESPGSQLTTVFPLFLYMKNRTKDTTASAAIPLYYYRRSSGMRDLITPISWSRKYLSGGSRGFILPVYWNTSQGMHTTGVFPITGVFRDTRSDSTRGYFCNLYWQSTPRSKMLTFFPLYFHSRDSGTLTDAFLPLYYYRSDPAKRDICTPVSWVRKYKSGGSRGFALPVYWNTSNSMRSMGIFPITGVFRDTRSGSAQGYFCNLYWRSTPGSKMLTFFPVYLHSRNADSLTDYFFPFYFYNRDQRRKDIVTPVFWVRKYKKGSSRGIIPPVYWNTEGDTRCWGVFPLTGFFKSRSGTSSRWYILNMYRRKTPDSEFTTFFPLYFSKTDKSEHTKLSTLVPFYFSRKDPYKKDVITPLFWVRKYRSGGSRGFVLPVYWNTSQNRNTWGIFPLAGHYENKDTMSVLNYFLIYMSQKSPEVSTKVLFPLLFSRHSSKSDSMLVVPIYWHYTSKETQISSRVVFPLYWRFRSRSGYTTKVIPPVYWRYSKEGDELASGLPLVWRYEREGQDRKYVSLFARMFGYERAGTKRRIFLLWIPIRISSLNRAGTEPVPEN